MKVITLERIKDLIESKNGKQTVTRTQIANREGKAGITIIHDAGTPCVGVYEDEKGEIQFNGDHAGIHCVLLETEVNDYHEMCPFIKSREALSGVLVIDGETPTEDELWSYMYKL